MVFLICCNEQPSLKTKVLNNPSYEDSMKLRLIGQWGGLGENSPVWDIRQDSIYYYNRSAAYPYTILNNDLIIYLPESKGILKNIKLIKDTLFWLDEQGLTVKAFRMKMQKSRLH